MKSLLALVGVFTLLAACAVGVISPSLMLREPPFATEQFAGSIADAVRCVGIFWQDEATQRSGRVYTWEVYSEPSAVKVRGPGGGTPPVSLIITFDDRTGKTIASAYTHSMFGPKDPRRTVTAEAFQACKYHPQ